MTSPYLSGERVTRRNQVGNIERNFNIFQD
jgi:hypothetical protein